MPIKAIFDNGGYYANVSLSDVDFVYIGFLFRFLASTLLDTQMLTVESSSNSFLMPIKAHGALDSVSAA